MKKLFKNFLIGCLVVVMSIQSGLAQGATNLSSGILVASDTASLPMIRGLQFNPSEPLDFNFVVDLADEAFISEENALKLVRYFMAVLAVPDKDIWVNLSPDGESRIIAPSFGATEAGEDLLKQDLILKKLSASFLHPDQELGRKFWDAAYKKIYEVYGLVEIPQDAFSRIWIVPQKAVIDEFKNAAYISESRLKVLMADEYDSFKGLDNKEFSGADDAHERIIAIMKDVIVPEIEKQVNEGEHFAVLRQVYHSMILAVWFKSKLKDHVVNRVYSDSSKTDGIALADRNSQAQTFESYLDIFRNGLYDTIREDYDPVRKEMVMRKYISGGYVIGDPGQWMETRKGENDAMLLTSGEKNILLSVSFFLLTAASAFAQSYGTNSVLSHQWPGQTEASARTDQVSQYRGDYTLLGKFATFDHVESLKKDAKYKTNVNWVLSQNGVNENNYQSFLRDGTYDAVDEVFVLAVQHELGITMDADYSFETENAIRGQLGQDTPQPQNLPGDAVVSGVQAPPGGSLIDGGTGGGTEAFKNLDRQFETMVDSINKSFQYANYADSIKLMETMNWKIQYDSLQNHIQEQDSTIANLIKMAQDTSVAGGSAPPPPDSIVAGDSIRINPFAAGSPFSATSLTDLGTWKDGDDQWGGLYDTKTITYAKDSLLLWTTIETTGLWGPQIPGYTVGQYVGGSYQVSPNVLLSTERRFSWSGDVNPLTMVKGKFTPNAENYSLTGLLSLPRMYDEDEDRYYNTSAVTLTTGTQFLGVDASFGYFYGPDDIDWSLNLGYNFTSVFGLSFEKNFSADYGHYGYIPNVDQRLNLNFYMGNSTLGLYVSEPTSNWDKPLQWIYGLAFSQSFNPAPAPPGKDMPKATIDWSSASDVWHGANSFYGHYGSDAFSLSQNNVSLKFMTERTYGYNPEDANYSPSLVFYAGPEFSVGNGFFKSVLAGIRMPVVNNFTKVNFIGTTFGGLKGHFSGDLRYGRSQTSNEDGTTTNLQGLNANLSYAFLKDNKMTVSAFGYALGDKDGGETSFDAGGSVSYALPLGFKTSFAINATSANISALFPAPDQHFRFVLGLPKAGLRWIGLPFSLGTELYVAHANLSDSYTAKGEWQPGIKMTVAPASPSATFNSTLDSKMNSIKVGLRMLDLPAGVSQITLTVNDSLTVYDKDLIKAVAVGGQLSKEDFENVYKTKKAARKRWIAFKHALKNIDAIDQYTKGLSYGIHVVKTIVAEQSGLSLDMSAEYDRQTLYTISAYLNGSSDLWTSTPSLDVMFNTTYGGSNKAMMSGVPGTQKKYGGVDLSVTESAIETRVHGAFEGLKNKDVDLINPETFRGFGVRLIQMRPIFNLSQVFTPDDAPVMISQL